MSYRPANTQAKQGDPRPALNQRIVSEIAETRVRYGYGRIHHFWFNWKDDE